jgi:hypothetical protein
MDRPEVRQCTDDKDPLFGTVVVRSPREDKAWAFVRPAMGGGFETRADAFDDWTVLTPE